MNNLLNALKNETNFTRTTNGALAHKTTKSKLLDMFALGGAMRQRSDADVILLFKEAYEENPVYALKCLFYLRDIRGCGQGERRFFRVCLRWLANYDKTAVIRNFENIPLMGRWDDLYCLEGTPVEKEAFAFIYKQLCIDIQSKTPSLLGKWLKSENASSNETKRLAALTRKYCDLTSREYRQMLSLLRQRINVLERLMSQNRWDEIEFDKIPSKAGLMYKNVFAHKEVTAARYAEFMQDKKSKVNAGALYPYEVVQEAIDLGNYGYWGRVDENGVNRLAINKYWDNLTDYFNGQTLNALCMIDTSGSMRGTPINVAISLGLYCAERAKGPFANHYISFSSKPQLIETSGFDFFDKVQRIYRTNLCANTNIEAAFDMLLETACRNRVKQKDLPENIIVVSDMQFDVASEDVRKNPWWGNYTSPRYTNAETLMDAIERKWNAAGYIMPKLIYWNVNASKNTIPQLGERISFVSGFSPSIFQTIMSGKSGYELMMDCLDGSRYATVC